MPGPTAALELAMPIRTLAALFCMTVPCLAANEIDVPDYRVEVALSTKASAKLKASGETVHVSAFYYGEAAKPKDGDEMGQVWLGNEDADIGGGGAVTFGKIKIDAKRLKLVKGRKATVNINVYTSRKVFENNLLDCGLFEDLVEVAAKAPVAIDCKLIGEE
jgi:hypothetical protein